MRPPLDQPTEETAAPPHEALTPQPTRRDHWLWLGAVVCAGAMVAPLWVTELLPLMDLPQHLATIRVLHSLEDPAFGLAPFYLLDLSSTQYLGYYYLVDLLAHGVEIETANRLVLSLYAVGVPLSMISYMRAFGRDPAVGLLAAPFAYNTFFFMGFANYVLALPLIFWGLGVLRGLMDELRWGRFALLVGITLCLFYTHAQAFLIYGLCAGLIGLLGGRGFHPRHWWRQSLHLVPTALLFLVWMSRSLILAGEEQWQAGHGGRNASPVEIRWEPLLARLEALPGNLLSGYRGDADEHILIALGVMAVGLLMARQLPEAPIDQASLGPRRTWLRSHLPEVLLGAVLLTYLLSPVSYKWIWPISHRLIPVLGLFAIGTLAIRHLKWRPILLVLPAIAISIWASSVHMDRAKAFEAEAGDVRDMLRHAEPSKRLMALIYRRGSSVVDHAPYLHFGQYYVLDRGGVATFSFVDFPQSPLKFDPEAGPPALPVRWEWTPEKFRYETHGAYYDYFLIRDEGPGSKRRPFRRHTGSVDLVKRAGQWALYKNKTATN